MPDDDNTTTTDKPAAKKATTKKAASSKRQAGAINDRQMRQMHVLLGQHGYTNRDDVHELMTVHVGREIESAKELSSVEAADFIAWLSEQSRTVTPAIVGALRAPFPAEAIGKLPRSTCRDCSDNKGTCANHPNKARCGICGNVHNVASSMHLDYVGHADVTDRLLQVDPFWSWRPFTADEIAGLAPALREGGMWIMLTVAGVTRPGFGDADGKRGGNAIKEMIGDALRNAAMRFGVALDLWAKGDRSWLATEKDGDDHGAGAPADADYDGPPTDELIAQLEVIAQSENTDLAGITAKFRERHSVTVEGLRDVPPYVLQQLVTSIEDYLTKRDEQAQQQQSEQS